MGAVNLKEARKRLGELVTAAEQGESITISRRGRAAARLVPVNRSGRARFPDLSDFRRSIRLRGAGLSATVVAMRRKERY